MSVDGKTLCGTVQPHGQSIHLLSLLDHAIGGVLGQLKMSPKTNEPKTAMLLLKSLVLKGKVITGDAMFCQRDLCEQTIDSGGDYLFTVKDNQPELNKTISSDFNPGLSPPTASVFAVSSLMRFAKSIRDTGELKSVAFKSVLD